jgi:hypothetical protein
MSEPQEQDGTPAVFARAGLATARSPGAAEQDPDEENED